jgi:hypothetical protein
MSELSQDSDLAGQEMLCHADFMIRMPRRGLVVLLLAVVAVAGYGVYHWQNAVPPGLQDRRIIASAIESNQATVNPTVASAVQTVTLATPKSLSQLHAAFRESQRCMEERIIIRGILSYHSGAQAPPHIPGCDDMKGALRKVHEATNAAAKSGDIDAQMCYLMQGAGDRESGFVLSDAEIAEYQSLGPQYVEAAFKRGDWRVVDLLGYRVIDWAGLFIGLEQWKDPAREYKAHQLLLLGAGDVDPQDSDYWLAALCMPESKNNWALSEQQLHDSDAWAQTMYEKYFNSQPRLMKEPTVCTGEDAPR